MHKNLNFLSVIGILSLIIIGLLYKISQIKPNENQNRRMDTYHQMLWYDTPLRIEIYPTECLTEIYDIARVEIYQGDSIIWRTSNSHNFVLKCGEDKYFQKIIIPYDK